METYPAHLETNFITSSGAEVRFRPVKPEDETILQDFFYSLSERTIYLRFFSHLKFFPLTFLRQFTHIDYSTHMTVVGLVEEGGYESVVAVGYYAVNSDTRMGEVSLIVRDDWQNRGVGTFLFQYLIKIAKESGLKGFTAEVLKNNASMIKLLHDTGFTVSPGAGKSSSAAELRFDEATPKENQGRS